jgi:hypothetical protein
MRRGMSRAILVVLGATCVLAMLRAPSADAQTTYVPGGGGNLPCYIGTYASASEEIKLFAPRSGTTRVVTVPVAESYCEEHGWAVSEECMQFADMDPASISAFVQTHGHVTMQVDGEEIAPVCITVVPAAWDAAWGASDTEAPGDPVWIIAWLFEFPAGMIHPGVFIVSVTYSRDAQLVCRFPIEEVEGTYNVGTMTVTVLYPTP